MSTDFRLHRLTAAVGALSKKVDGWDGPKINLDPKCLLPIVFLVLLFLRIPTLTGLPNLSQDATEYIDIARNVATGNGLTLRIRGYFFADGYGVPYPSQSLRSPLFPLLMGAAHAAIPSPALFQWFNFVLFSVNMGLLSALLWRALPPWLALYSVLLAGLTEPMFLTSIFPWAEQTALLWLLLALLAASVELHRRWGPPGAVAEGAVCALAGLSRPEYLLLGFLFIAWLLWRRSGASAVAAFLSGMLLPLVAVSAINYRCYGRTFLPGDYLFHTREYGSYFSWAGKPADSSPGFLAQNWLWIGGRVGRNAVNYVAKLIGWKNLFLATAALPLVLRKAFRNQYDPQKRALALIATAFFAAYCLVWAGMDRERYLLAITPFWLPLCVYELDLLRKHSPRLWMRHAGFAFLLVNLPLSVGNLLYSATVIQGRHGLAERFYAKPNISWSNPDLPRLTDWIRTNVGAQDVLCLENPFLVNYETQRPAIVLPEQLAPGRFLEFLHAYGVRYWINNSTFTKRRLKDLASLRRAIESSGAALTARCGTYEVWAVPASMATVKPPPRRAEARTHMN
jgi:hypothetical protein